MVNFKNPFIKNKLVKNDSLLKKTKKKNMQGSHNHTLHTQDKL